MSRGWLGANFRMIKYQKLQCTKEQDKEIFFTEICKNCGFQNVKLATLKTLPVKNYQMYADVVLVFLEVLNSLFFELKNFIHHHHNSLDNFYQTNPCNLQQCVV